MAPNDIDTFSLDVYVAFCKRRSEYPLHWMLLVANPGSQRCTWYHVVGGPSQNREFERKIQAEKRIDSHGIATKTWISNISASEAFKVKEIVDSVPLRRCQRWTTDVLAGLEREGLVPPGTSGGYQARIEPSPYEMVSPPEEPQSS